MKSFLASLVQHQYNNLTAHLIKKEVLYPIKYGLRIGTGDMVGNRDGLSIAKVQWTVHKKVPLTSSNFFLKSMER